MEHLYGPTNLREAEDGAEAVKQVQVDQLLEEGVSLEEEVILV